MVIVVKQESGVKLNFVQFLLEFYVGNDLTSRQNMALPFVLAIEQAKQICMELSKEEQPIKAVFINEFGDRLEYKNNSYIKFEGGN